MGQRFHVILSGFLYETFSVVFCWFLSCFDVIETE